MLRLLVLLFLSVTVNSLAQCPHENTHQYYRKIVDINRSIQRGARLLKGIGVSSFGSCFNECCQDSECDMALYRRIGMSSAGHNCYMISCGVFTSCVLVQHDDFTTVHIGEKFEITGDDSDKDNVGTGREHSVVNKPRPQPHVAPTPSIKATISTRTSPSPHPPLVNKITKTIVKSQSTSSDVIVSSPTPILEQKHENGSAKNVTVVSSTPVIEDETPVDNEIPYDQSEPSQDSCQGKGCGSNGYDVIAGVVVSTVGFLVVFVVGALIVRKLYQNRQLRHYHNVDYLINGMYS